MNNSRVAAKRALGSRYANTNAVMSFTMSDEFGEPGEDYIEVCYRGVGTLLWFNTEYQKWRRDARNGSVDFYFLDGDWV